MGKPNCVVACTFNLVGKMFFSPLSRLIGPLIEFYAFYCLLRKRFLSRQYNSQLSIRGPKKLQMFAKHIFFTELNVWNTTKFCFKINLNKIKNSKGCTFFYIGLRCRFLLKITFQTFLASSSEMQDLFKRWHFWRMI